DSFVSSSSLTTPPPPSSTLFPSRRSSDLFAMAARRLGYRVHTFAPEHDTPTGQIADVEVNASYDDLAAVRRFAQGVDVVTFEFRSEERRVGKECGPRLGAGS